MNIVKKKAKRKFPFFVHQMHELGFELFRQKIQKKNLGELCPILTKTYLAQRKKP